MRLLTSVTVPLVVLLCVSASNAAECSFYENKSDPFSKDAFLKTEWKLLTKWSHSSFNQKKGFDFEIYVRAVTEGQLDYLVLKMELKDSTIFQPGPNDMRNAVTVREGDLVRITLVDESVVELPAEKTVWAPTRLKRKDDKYIYRATLESRYLVSAESAQALIRQDAKRLFMESVRNGSELIPRDEELDFKIKDKMQREIKRGIRCLELAN